MISQNPTTIQLRYLQTLSEIGINQNSTIVFPIDLVQPLLNAADGGRGEAAARPSCRRATASPLRSDRGSTSQADRGGQR